jgi:hypothetical protein
VYSGTCIKSGNCLCCEELATGWTIGVLGFDSLWGLGIFLFTTASRTALGPTQLPIQWVPGTLSLGVKCSGREADHSTPSSAEVKECVELYLHPQYVFMAWCSVKKKHLSNFNLLLLPLLWGGGWGRKCLRTTALRK